jgi:5'/3'-nucleotidase
MRRRSQCTGGVRWAAALLLGVVLTRNASAAPLRVLVANDDGVSAEGISVLVAKLSANHNLDVQVFAPATNQSGTGDSVTNGLLEVFASNTAGGHPATAVNGFPADCVLFGVLRGLPARPDLVVTGVNIGQNLGEIVRLSGTVGAALTAARLGIPAIAASQALGSGIRFDAAASFVASLVEKYRTNATFRRAMRSPSGLRQGYVLNVNFPTCTSGKVRGVRVVPLGRTQQFTAYEPAPSPAPADNWQPVVEKIPLGSNDCTSKLRNPRTDLEAMNNGFATVTPLNADFTATDHLATIRGLVER